MAVVDLSLGYANMPCAPTIECDVNDSKDPHDWRTCSGYASVVMFG